MPRVVLPLTPASSTEIPGKDGSRQLACLQTAFELPPPALTASRSSVDSERLGSDSQLKTAAGPVSTVTDKVKQRQHATPYPVQAAETVKARRRTSSAQTQAAMSKDAFALPPPPTRTRKIIQMKPPKSQEDGSNPEDSSKAVAGDAGKAQLARKTSSFDSVASEESPATTKVGKRKQPSATSAAGRKMARKTAHSLIERRRRSKMNEEFAVLKDMIPACTGEMHKLAILQASIEYVRYLKDCVSRLQAQHDSAIEDHTQFKPSIQTHLEQNHTPSPQDPYPPFQPRQYTSDVDVEMTGSSSGEPSPTTSSFSTKHLHQQSHQPPPPESSHPPSISRRPSISPALLPRDSSRHSLASYRSPSCASTTTTDQRHYSFGTASALTSPALGPQIFSTSSLPQPQLHHSISNLTSSRGATGTFPSSYSRPSSRPGSTLTSPALLPLADMRDRDLDQEATAALLMLNHDRRGLGQSSSALSGGGTRNGSLSEHPVVENGSGAGSHVLSAGRGMSVRDMLSS